MKRTDLTNKTFGRLTVLDYAYTSKNGRPFWRCKCVCGNVKDIAAKDLKRGTIRSCGCLRRETVSIRRKTHGSSRTRLYCIWLSMKHRCETLRNGKAHKYYVERGIVVCKEWHDFSVFQKWAFENGYNDNLTIDRIDNNGNYCPENCRWTDILTQANNKRNNVKVTYKNKTQTIAQWAREIGMKYTTLDVRLLKGWTVEAALTTPVMRRRKI